VSRASATTAGTNRRQDPRRPDAARPESPGPRRGSLVVFESPTDATKILIKRVVGVAGDRVEARDGALFVNDDRESGPHVNYRPTDPMFFGPMGAPEGHVFVMGDNRSNCKDSGSFGAVPEDGLLGKVFVRFWPPGRAGTPQQTRDDDDHQRNQPLWEETDMSTHAGEAGSIPPRAVTPPPSGPTRGDFGGVPAGLETTSSGEVFGEPRDAEGANL
jgi:signal peptidase I